MPLQRRRRTRLPAALAGLAGLLGLLGGVGAAPPAAAAGPPTLARPHLVTGSTTGAADPTVRVVRDPAGRVRLLAADGARVPGLAAGASAVTAARAQLDRVGRAFGVSGRDLRTTAVTRVAGRDVVRFQQTRAGLPVLGGQLVTVLDGHGGLLSVSGEIAGPAVSTAYDVAASTAQRTAVRAVARVLGVRPAALQADRPARWLLDRSLLDPRAAARTVPVWRVPVRSASRPDVRQLVLVDARTGRVALRLDEVEPLDRVVCDDVRVRSYRCRAGGYDRVEGGPPTGVPDADQAYDLTGVTATWYAAALGVDLTALIGSDFGDGSKLRSTTHYCPPGACPLDNAFWSGDQMVYGAGYTSADDVVAHELSHGVTQHTAGLVYWYQSGAINESMSDVLGELVDLADGVGNDAPDQRWLLGEDLPPQAGGVTRDMADPARFGQPDSTRSTLYDVALDYDDNGGVHTNSGVPNKTAYLISDGTAAEPGGAFRGRAFAGIGPERTATLYWATLQMLTPGSDFVDLANGLRQACLNLAFTAEECASVGSAVDATELARWAGPTVPRRVVMAGGPGEVALSWLRPASTGSTALVSYIVAVSPDVQGDGFWTVDPTATDFLLRGLSSGVDYTVRLVAVSTNGTSPPVTRVLSGSALSVTGPASVPYGGRVRLSGALRNATGAGLAGRRVRLMRRDAGTSGYRLAATLVTGPTGGFHVGWPAARSSSWYLLYPGAAAEIGARTRRHGSAVPQRVSLEAGDLTVREGQTVELAGRVFPQPPDRAAGVAVQRRGPDGAWVTVQRAPLHGGRWAVGWPVRTDRPTELRLRVPARPALGLAAGLSRVVVLNPR